MPPTDSTAVTKIPTQGQKKVLDGAPREAQHLRADAVMSDEKPAQPKEGWTGHPGESKELGG